MLDLGSERLSWRRFGNLVSRLPVGSQLDRDTRGPEATWGNVEHLLAIAVDVLQVANWQRSADKKTPRPVPLPRPGDGLRRLDAEEVRRRLADLRRRDADRKKTLDGR